MSQLEGLFVTVEDLQVGDVFVIPSWNVIEVGALGEDRGRAPYFERKVEGWEIVSQYGEYDPRDGSYGPAPGTYDRRPIKTSIGPRIPLLLVRRST